MSGVYIVGFTAMPTNVGDRNRVTGGQTIPVTPEVFSANDSKFGL